MGRTSAEIVGSPAFLSPLANTTNGYFQGLASSYD